MFRNKYSLLTLVLILFVGVLAGCKGNDSASTGDKNEGGNAQPKEGGSIVGAMDSAPAGIFNPLFYTDSYENNILSFTHEALVAQNDKLEFIPNLAKSWEFNKDQTELTLKLEEGVKWHDGEPFTANDVVYTYKTISDPEYISAGGVRNTYAVRLKGYEEYSSGKTDKFEGVIAVDDHTVKFVFAEPNVIGLADASFNIVPEHVFKDIPIAEIPEHAASLKPNDVVGTGPFKFSEMVEGEQYVLAANKEYWKGAPKLDHITWKIVEQSVILGLLENGEIDFIADPNGFQAADYEQISSMEHLQIIEQPDFGYQIMGFMINHRTPEDADAGTIKPENFVPNKKIADKRVRQAIAYAIDRQGLIDGLLYGRGEIMNSPIATQFWAYDGEKPNQYKHNVEKAKSLLDDAGYKDKDGDGFREDPDGKKWILTLNYPTGNQIRERSAPIIKEFLEKAGIKIDLRQPKEFAAYAEDLEKNNQDWDLYLLGWSLDSDDPDPSGLWDSGSGYNYGRWYNKEADQLLKDAFAAPDAFDQEYRKKVYSDWQVKFQDDLPALILYAANSLWAHNKRLQGIDTLPHTFINDPEKWYVTE